MAGRGEPGTPRTVAVLEQEPDPERDEPDGPRDVCDRDDRAGQFPAALLIGAHELERPDQHCSAGRDADPAQPAGQDVSRQDRGRDEQCPRPRQEVAQMLADAHPEQAVECGEEHLDRSTRRDGIGAIRRDISTGQLGHGEGPANQANALNEGRRRTDDDRRHRERRRSADDHREQRDERQHRNGAQEQRVPAKDETGSAGGEAPENVIRLLAQDVRVVEGAAELEEGRVERDRHGDQQDRRCHVGGHAPVRRFSTMPTPPTTAAVSPITWNTLPTRTPGSPTLVSWSTKSPVISAAINAPTPSASGTRSPTNGVHRAGPNSTITAEASRTLGPARLGYNVEPAATWISMPAAVSTSPAAFSFDALDSRRTVVSEKFLGVVVTVQDSFSAGRAGRMRCLGSR